MVGNGDAFVSDGGSFRDRDNQVFDNGTEILRGVSAEALEHWKALEQSSFFRELASEKKLVDTRFAATPPSALAEDDAWAGWLAHERIPFVTYPYEWSFGMLKDAAALQLELVERAFEEGWTLKDATAYNFQWIGSRPVFIDIPSFVPYVAGRPWVGYRQFCMMFLYPLMLQAYKGVDFQPFLRADLEGIDPASASRLLSGASRLRGGVLTHAYLHSRMQARYSNADLDEAKTLTEDSGEVVSRRKGIHHSKAMVLGTIQSLRRLVKKLKPREARTTWGNYDSEHSYGDASFEIKKRFVETAAAASPRDMVWDLGCNTGTFSEICERHARYVISVDGDPKAIERLYQAQKRKRGENICPIIMNLANISPNQGWRGAERKAFDERGKPGLVLCLALIHHVVISSNIPLSSYLSWLRGLDSEIVFELVTLDDDMAKMLLRNRENQYHELTVPGFEAAIEGMFRVVTCEPLKGGHRKLYHLAPA